MSAATSDPHPPFTALLLAAGMGKRMNSDLPKVLHPALGTPLIGHVLARLAPLFGGER